jgi:hypoxia up-regulated 1
MIKHCKILMLLGVILLAAMPKVNGNLIGFDFGSNFMKATLVKAGKPFSIIENTASKRKTETMVSIGVENRLFGADSFLESGKYPKTTLNNIHRTFGRKFDSEWIEKMKEERFIFNEYVADERGHTAWKITRPAFGDQEEVQEILFNEEVAAMLLGYVKMLAEIQAETTVRDCVITIPSWYTYD